MITIVEWKSKQQFESKKLASEYFKIPIWLINKSIQGRCQVSYEKGTYRFQESRIQNSVTKILNVKKSEVIPFGRHKGKKPEDVPLGYLIWMYKKTDCPDCVLKALKEVKSLF
tara:strand:+ start:2817 stop:3155 length:339 start_codon:yes stop_codon:yes gene_type:complete